MCRLCAITATDLDTVLHTGATSLLLHELMLRGSCEDGGQKDGWGVSNGQTVVKSGAYYMDDAPSWIPVITQAADQPLIGHVRKASTQTGRTVAESHPYQFEVAVGGQTRLLTAAHNGWISGTTWHDWKSNDPQTDSWRALNDLSKLLVDQDEITTDIVERWLNEYESASQFAFLLSWGKHLYAVRGNRPLFGLRVGNGYMLHTSNSVLDTMRRYLQAIYQLVVPAVMITNPNQLIRLTPGDHEVVSRDFTLHQPVTKTRVWNNGWEPNRGNAITGNQSGSENAGNVTVVTAPRVTTARTVSQPRVSGPVEGLTTRRELWSKLCQMVTPLRSPLLRMWATQLLGYDMVRADPSRFLQTVSVEDMEHLHQMLLPTGTTSLFGYGSNLRLNVWNHIVLPGEHNIEYHRLLFGSCPFWLPTEDDFIGIKEVEVYVNNMIDWSSDLAGAIMDSVTAGEINAHNINLPYLKKMLDEPDEVSVMVDLE